MGKGGDPRHAVGRVACLQPSGGHGYGLGFGNGVVCPGHRDLLP